MALSRSFLKSAGLTDEQISAVTEEHTNVTNRMQKEIDKYKEIADKLPDVQKELDKLKGGEDWQKKYEDEHKAFEDFKKDQTAKETKAAKESAARAYFEGKSITGRNLNIAMRGAKDEINGLELDADGKIKDTSALDALVGGEYAALVVTTQTRGANTATPPAGNGGSKLTRADIYKKDDHGRYVMSTVERQKALAENPDLMK
jgi:hypothetical protein